MKKIQLTTSNQSSILNLFNRRNAFKVQKARNFVSIDEASRNLLARLYYGKARDMNETLTEPTALPQHQHGWFGRIVYKEHYVSYKGPSSEEIQELFGDALESTRKLHHGFPWEPGYLPNPSINSSRN